MRYLSINILNFLQKLKKAYRTNPSEKLQSQILDKEKTLKILEAQLQGGPSQPNTVRESQVINSCCSCKVYALYGK